MGKPFEAVWERALAALPEPERNGGSLGQADLDRAYVVAALGQTKGEWERAYHRQPALPPPKPSPLRFSPI
jgi:hypothetical protein